MTSEPDPGRITEFVEIGPRFAQLLHEAVAYGAPNFAGQLAVVGASPKLLRVMIKHWRDWGHEPLDFALVLERFADDVERIVEAGRR